MYQNIFEKSTDGMLIIEDGKFINCNNAVVKMLRYKNKEQLLNTHPYELSPKYQSDGRTSFERVQENAEIVMKNGTHTFEWIHLRSNGEPFWVEVVITDISKANKGLSLVVWREIGKKKQLEEANIYQQMILTSVLNSTNDLIFYKDYTNEDGRYIGCNDSFGEFVGKSKEEIIGKDDIELFGKELGVLFREKDLDVIRNKVNITNEESVSYPNGDEVLLSTQKSLLKDNDENIIGIMGIARDITIENNYKIKIKEKMEENKLLANTDPLTGIDNRRSFFEISEKLIKLSQRNKTQLTLMMLDIDFFKKVNDIYGHIIGDDILIYVTKTIKGRLRESDVFSRYGGEEFIILLSDTDLKNGLEIAEEIRLMFSNNIYNDGKISIPIKMSIGVSQYKNESLMREFIQRVDENLYKAKENGRNRVEGD